jgi:hypothetical protein
MSVPEESIISRSHQIRIGRRLRAATGALASATGMVLAVVSLANPAPSHSSDIRLAAWTVVSKHGGFVWVTIRELRDPAGLERRLLANGIPASISYHGHPNTACRLYPADRRRYERVFPAIDRARSRPLPVKASRYLLAASSCLKAIAVAPSSRSGPGLSRPAPGCNSEPPSGGAT